MSILIFLSKSISILSDFFILFSKKNKVTALYIEPVFKYEIFNFLAKIFAIVLFPDPLGPSKAIIKGDKVFLNEKDVSEKIRNKEVTENVSWVSSIFLVRKYLVDMQRKISQNKSIILDGRDIGTVVFPNAKYKFFLVASSEVRAKRRYEQNEIDKSLEEIQKDIEKRDYLDSHREISPLKKAEDAIEIDSSNLTIDETIEEIINKMDKEDVL